jgi:hypothetical protein
MSKRFTIQNEIQLINNLRVIHKMLYAWTDITNKYPLTIRNGETGSELDAWELILRKLNNSIETIENLHPGLRTQLKRNGQVNKVPSESVLNLIFNGKNHNI